MKYIDPYDEGDGYVPRSTGITRGHAMRDLYEAAASVGRRRKPVDEYIQYEVDPSPYERPQSPNPFVPTRRQQPQSPYGPESRPPMEMPQDSIFNAPTQGQQRWMDDDISRRLEQEARYGTLPPGVLEQHRRRMAEQEADALIRERQARDPSVMQQVDAYRPYMSNTASPATPMSLADTFSPAAIAAQRAQREAENRPGANAIFKPQPVTGGRPDNVADNVANDVIARAAIASARGDANADDLMTQAATLAWQREAALNGNERGDVRAPQDYIESWKGQVRAGEAGSPFADMFGRATNVARQSFAAEEVARREAASAQERRMMEAERAQRAQRQPPPYVGNGTPPYMGNAPMGGGEYGVTRGPTPGYTAYPTARGGESSESQYGTRRLNSSVAEQAYDDDLITRVMNGVRNPSSSASLPTSSGPLPAYLQGRQPRAGLQSGKDDPGDQAAQVWSSARALGGDEFADAVGGLIVAEGGLTGATGDTHLDPRGSHGPFQFYAKGELQPFRQAMSKKYGREISEQEAMQLARNVDEVTAYYLPKLYGAYQDAKKKGFTGDDLTVGLAAGAFDESGAGHNRGITSDPNKFYPIYRNGLKNFRSGTFAQSGSIAALANQGR